MIADEVMCGWGRTGEWFAVDHWDVVPDLITTAKGLTSSYAPLGAVGFAPEIAAHFEDNVFWGGLTYNTHPLGVAAAIAAIDVLEDDDLVGNAKRLDPVMRAHHEALAAKHPSVGLTRNIGLFGIIELVKNRETMEPMSPYNQMNDTMQQLNRFLIDNGLATFIRWWNVMTNPPAVHHRGAARRRVRDHRPGARDHRRRDGGLRMGDRLGFIGLGIMGKPMARNLLDAGFPLTVYSRIGRPRRRAGRSGRCREQPVRPPSPKRATSRSRCCRTRPTSNRSSPVAAASWKAPRRDRWSST